MNTWPSETLEMKMFGPVLFLGFCLSICVQNSVSQWWENDYFYCDDGFLTIPEDYYCDDYQDCFDAADETNCGFFTTPGPTPGPTPGHTPGTTPGPTPGTTPGHTPGTTPGPTPSPTTSPIQSISPDTSAYCALDPTHTMCIFAGPSPSCSANTLFSGLDASSKAAIVARHNDLRSRVAKGEETNGQQPAAANMRKLVWNDDLAEIAQRWTDQCNELGPHDDSRGKLDGTPVGQNQAMWMTSQPMSAQDIRASFANMPQGWYDEVKDPGFDRNGVDNFTDEVGCGLVYYLDGSRFTTLVHCNYATAGNWGGQSLYRRGGPCTECPKGFNFCENGLCSKQ